MSTYDEWSEYPMLLSRWIDASYPSGLDKEAWMWRRVEKINEECGEVSAAIRGVIGENPRKGVVGTWDDVIKELTDVAVSALGAIEHLTGNEGQSVAYLSQRLDVLVERAGLIPARSS